MNEQLTTGNPTENSDAANEQNNLHAPAPSSLPDDQPTSALATPPPKKKRNSGRSGPTSLAGRLRSSRNAIKHGACAETLILPCESEPAFLILLARWCREYHISEEEQALVNNAHCGPCTDHSLTYDFVRRAAEADWHRIRCQRSYDSYSRMYIDGRAPFNWTPAEVKMHDLHLRYKTAADRAFHRENRALQQHLKFQQEQKRWQQRRAGKSKRRLTRTRRHSQKSAPLHRLRHRSRKPHRLQHRHRNHRRRQIQQPAPIRTAQSHPRPLAQPREPPTQRRSGQQRQLTLPSDISTY